MKFYRYYNTRYDSDIHEEVYELVKETPCGYWIVSDYIYKRDGFLSDYHEKKWVSKTTRKRFAYPTKKEALVSFRARKRNQVKHLNNQLTTAKAALHKAEKQGEITWHLALTR